MFHTYPCMCEGDMSVRAPSHPYGACRHFGMPRRSPRRSGGRPGPIPSDLDGLSPDAVQSTVRQKARDHVRAHFKTPVKDRSGRAAPGQDGYESSDLEDDNLDARPSPLQAYAARKFELKRIEKRTAAITVKLGRGICTDLQFWFELSKVGRASDDYRSAVDHAFDQNESLGDYQPADEGPVSVGEFKQLMHSFMLHRYTPVYLEEASEGVIGSIGQTPSESIQMYKLRADRLLQALMYLFDHESVNARERSLLSKDFTEAWIHGLCSIDADALATRFVESALNNAPLTLQQVYNKALAAFSSKRMRDDTGLTELPRKRLAQAAVLSADEAAKIRTAIDNLKAQLTSARQ